MLCISGRIADAEVPVGVLLFRWLDDRHYVDARNQLRTTPRTAGGPRPDTQGKIARGGHTRKNRHPWRERHTMTDTPCFGNHTIAMKPTALSRPGPQLPFAVPPPPGYRRRTRTSRTTIAGPPGAVSLASRTPASSPLSRHTRRVSLGFRHVGGSPSSEVQA